MARRRESGFEVIAAVPWPVGVACGIVASLGIRYGIGWFCQRFGGPLLAGFAQGASAGIFTPLAWMALVVCWIAALTSFLKRRQRRFLFDTRNGLASLATIDWREFEQLVGEAFRRQGYVVEEHGQGGADGGIDLILRKHGRKTLVQCKQWTVREGLIKAIQESRLAVFGPSALCAVMSGFV